MKAAMAICEQNWNENLEMMNVNLKHWPKKPKLSILQFVVRGSISREKKILYLHITYTPIQFKSESIDQLWESEH